MVNIPSGMNYQLSFVGRILFFFELNSDLEALMLGGPGPLFE